MISLLVPLFGRMPARSAFFLLLSSAALFGASDCHLFEGKTIESMEWQGLRRVRPEVAERGLPLAVGEPLSCERLEQSLTALEGLDLFASLSFRLQESEEGVHLSWIAEELPPWLPLPSAKISDQDGWLIGPSVIGLNFLQQNIRLEAHFRMTLWPEWLRAQEYTFSLSSPWLGDLPMEYDVRLIRTDSWNPLKEYDERSWEWGAEFAYRLGKSGWRGVVWGEAFQAEHRKHEAEWSFLSDSHHDRSGVLGAGVRWDRRDRPLDTRKGRWLELRGGWGGEPLGNAGSWGDWLADLRLWSPLPGVKTVLHSSFLARWRPGTVPYPLYFHQGGINSLRGLSPEPERASRDEFLATLEVRQPLLERRPFRIFGHSLYAAVQGVAGLDVVRQGFGRNSTGFLTGYAGIHLLLPGLDRIRIEAARSEEEGFSLSIGLYEKAVAQRWRNR